MKACVIGNLLNLPLLPLFVLQHNRFSFKTFVYDGKTLLVCTLALKQSLCAEGKLFVIKFRNQDNLPVNCKPKKNGCKRFNKELCSHKRGLGRVRNESCLSS